jgi:cytochrome P450 family 110
MQTLPPGPSSPKALQLFHWARRPIPFMQECARRYGDCFTVQFPHAPPIVLFSDPKALKEIFTGSLDDLRAGEANASLEPFAGPNSLFLLDGKRHLRERKLLMPPFHGERMQAYGEIIRDLTDQTIDRWPKGEPFSLHPQMQHITLEVILRTVFGIEDGERLSRLRDLLTRLLDGGANALALILLIVLPGSKVRRLLESAIEPISLGPLGQLDVGQVLPWRKVAEADRDVDEILYAEIRKRREEGRGDRQDVLSMLVEARDEEGSPMTDEELRDEMMTLLAAGHETTATSLAWTFYNILTGPEETRKKLDEELEEVAGEEPLQPGHVQKLEYLDAVIKESLRLTPIIPIVARKLQRPMTIGGHALPAGVLVTPCIYLTHHRPDVWALPGHFWPDRFLTRKQPDPYEFFPFGGGVRRCLGMAFALYEMKVVLAEIVKRVRLRLVPDQKVKLVHRGFIFAPSGGVKVIAESRA